MKKGVISVFLAAILILTGCAGTAAEESAVPTVPTAEVILPTEQETVPETTVPAGPVLLECPESGKVCVGFLPTEAGSWRYVVIEDQAAAVAAYDQAAGSIYSDEWWIKGDRTKGLMVVYGEIWDFVESGELVYSLGRVKAEDAAGLYALCEEAAREAGWKEPVNPEQLHDITRATLRLSGKEIPVDDPAALAQLEGMLGSAKYSLGGTSCPFTALLDVQRQDGQVLTIALATDSCGVWMSEGYFYDYGNDSQPLYDLFGVTLKFGEPVQ